MCAKQLIPVTRAAARYHPSLDKIFLRAGTNWSALPLLVEGGAAPVKIAQIAPLMESVPPRLYGGTERVVSYLTEELVKLGHDVTLFASGDSITSARLVSCATVALRLDPNVI